MSLPATGPSPRRLVRLELLRTLASGALLPGRLAGDVLSRGRRLREFEGLWRGPAAAVETAPRLSGEPRPLCIFLSCAEASGEHHAIHLKAAIEAQLAEAGWPAARFLGLGGPRLAASGVQCVGDPVAKAAMGFGVAKALPFYMDLLERAAAALRSERPELCIGVDSPALHGPLAGLAKAYGIKTLQFVAPQHWAWAPWRTRMWRARQDLSLTILPFEPAWFASRGVSTRHVGHPILDELPPASSGPQRQRLVLLPGSRRSVVARHLGIELELARRLRQRQPDLEVVIAQGRSELGGQVAAEIERAGAGSWARLELGDLHASLAGARAAIAVSGTVLLDLLHQRVPALVLYRVGSRLEEWVGRRALSVPCFAIINLLAGALVLPEFGFRDPAPLAAMETALQGLWESGPTRSAALEGLETAARRLGSPGANRRAAGWALALATAGGPGLKGEFPGPLEANAGPAVDPRNR
jgi:lipid-A-disaccharide synthase